MSEERKPQESVQPVEAEEQRQETGIARAPDYKAHYGRVQASVWVRTFDERTVYSVSLTRSYKDEHDRWQRTTQLDENDLLPATEALRDAYRWIQGQRHQSRQDLHDLQTPPRTANG